MSRVAPGGPRRRFRHGFLSAWTTLQLHTSMIFVSAAYRRDPILGHSLASPITKCINTGTALVLNQWRNRLLHRWLSVCIP